MDTQQQEPLRRIELYGDGIGAVELVSCMGTDLTVVNSARVSFGVEHQKVTARDRKLIKYLIEHKHTSTLEHCVATFKFTVPLFIRSQHHRHRTWSYNEISRRYTDVNIQFYEPTEFRMQSESNRQASTDEMADPKIAMPGGDFQASKLVSWHHKSGLDLYNKLLEAGVCREQARGVLPQNMYTQYYGTVNLNNLIKFIYLRLHEGAQWEIQQVARACLDIAEEIWPVTVGAFREIHEGGK